MLATYPQYSPQALGSTPFGAALFGQPGQEPGFAAGGPFAPSPFAQNPFVQSHVPWQTQYAVGQQLLLAVGQLAQHISIQSALNQQIAAVLHQLTQQLQLHSVPGLAGIGMGQPFGQQAYGQQPFGQQPYGQMMSPFSQPAWQAWGGQRPQTIQ